MKRIIPILFILSLAISCQVGTQKKAVMTASPAVTSAPTVTSTPGEDAVLPYQWVDVSEFAAMMNGPHLVILDVRTPEETIQGKITGAIEINVLADDFVQKVNKLDKEKTYLVYCRSGRRSTKACEAMAAEGFTHLYNLIGGYNAWSDAH